MRVLVFLLLVTAGLAGCANTPGATEAVDDVLDDVITAPSGTIVSPSGVYNLTGPYSRVLEEGALEILDPVRFTIPSPVDGVDIEMGLWLPEGDGPFPVMLFSSPYFGYTGRTVDNPGGSVQNLIEQLVPHGYAFATHAVRGTAGSDGCNDLMGPKETDDIDAAVTWLGTQEWSNGNIAMTGVSYDGSTPWGVASKGNPHLKTIIPISGVPDMHGLMYRNGSSETRGPLLLNALYIAGGVTSAPQEEIPFRAVCPDAYHGLATSGIAAFTGYDATGWWQERNRKAGVEANYQGSVFSVQGLQDWNVDPSQVIPWVDELDKQGMKTKQLLGQWGHAWPDGIGRGDEMDPEQAFNRQTAYRADHQEILLRWLDSELKGEDVDTGPAVQIRDSLGRWRSEDHFPPRDATWTPYQTSANGYLVEEGAVAADRILLPNPNGNPTLPGGLPVEDASISVDFRLNPAEEEQLISGLPLVHVTVTPHGPGGYMAAYIYEESPTGDLRRLGWTTMNLLYAAGGTEPVPVVPGQPLEVKMEVQPMDGVIREGHNLLVRLWVFTDGDRLPTLPPNGVTLHIGPESLIKIPTIERDESVYFTPPTAQNGGRPHAGVLEYDPDDPDNQ